MIMFSLILYDKIFIPKGIMIVYIKEIIKPHRRKKQIAWQVKISRKIVKHKKSRFRLAYK
jgi:hypothetical protein